MDPNTNPAPRTFGSLGEGDTFSFQPIEHDSRCIKEGPTTFRYYLGSYGQSGTCEAERPVYFVKTEAERNAESDARAKEEARQRRERASAFRKVCAKVAQQMGKELGGKWALEPLPKVDPENPPMGGDPAEQARGMIVLGSHRIALNLGTYRSAGQRIQIRGCAPRGVSDVVITVAPDKEPAAIARAIARRVMPEYLAACDKANAKQKAEDEYKATIAANVARMVKAGASPRAHRPDSGEFYAAGNRCDVTTDSVRMDLSGLTLAQAERIVRILAKD